MTALSALWLPILVSTVIVFAASFVIHAALPWHRGDYSKAPNEDKLMDAIRPLAPPPGDYMMPCASGGEEMRSPAFAEKMKRGPVMIFTVRPSGPFSMSTNLVQWFVYCAVIGFLSAYVASHALPSGALYLRVFQSVCTIAFLAYAAALWQMSIWYGRAWKTTLKATVDGLVYALLTAGTFGWLWPR